MEGELNGWAEQARARRLANKSTLVAGSSDRFYPMQTPKPRSIRSVPMLDVNRGNASLRQEVMEAMMAVVDSGRFLHGPAVAELEHAIAEVCQTKHAIGCASGSDALLLALMALDVGPGDEVILPSFTFFATASCVSRLGAKIVFVDIEPNSYNIDPTRVARAVTSRTKAIIPVHLFGQCAAMDEICKIADRKGIAVIEDAAQAIGAAHCGRHAGSWGTIGCLSFYPTKNLGGMGDGECWFAMTTPSLKSCDCSPRTECNLDITIA